MKFFSRKPAWRDKSGRIVCKGDACPADCDNSCPIWLNTMALQLLQCGNPDQAIVLLNAAIEIAPDFPDLYNNLGSAYGMSNQHQEAYRSFKKAYELKPQYMTALFGIIVSEKNLGMFDEAISHCKEYESLGGDASALRESIHTAQFPEEDAVEESMLERLLSIGRSAGYIKSIGFSSIPEILISAESVCKKLLIAITKHQKEHPADVDNPLALTYMWSALAGMGAVYHWNDSWERLSLTGIYETLTAERGVFAMDEYVFDIIGIPEHSLEHRELTRFLWSLVDTCIDDIEDNEDLRKKLIEHAKAMFCWGMVYEMNRLGMK